MAEQKERAAKSIFPPKGSTFLQTACSSSTRISDLGD
jgi:hypothetical protein